MLKKYIVEKIITNISEFIYSMGVEVEVEVEVEVALIFPVDGSICTCNPKDWRYSSATTFWGCNAWMKSWFALLPYINLFEMSIQILLY